MADPICAFREAIHAALGYAPELIEPGRLHRFATSERRGDDAGWCKLFADLRGGVFGCNRSGESHSWSAIDRHGMTPGERAALARSISQVTRERQAAQRDEWAVNSHRIASMLKQCIEVTAGDPVHRYLCRRLAVDRLVVPGNLRLHRGLTYWHELERIGAFPTMVATMTTNNHRVVALHRTYLTDDGHKAEVPVVKKLTGAAGPLAGASIRLAAPQRGVLGVAEGIETALAASLASGLPVQAAYCASALAGYQWPAGVQRLVVFADADPAGREAADKLKARALRAWLRVNVMTPTSHGSDWADVWAARAAVTVEAAV